MSKTVFTKDIANKKMIIERAFDVPLPLVWKAWTDSTILDQWWAPKPWKAETKFMDFREGGYWLYCMNGPEGEKHWGRADYERIIPEQRYSGQDGFCDEDGNKNDELPSMHWDVQFSKSSNGTQVIVHITFPSVEAMETIIEMGFKEGFASAHDNLDALLAAVSA